MTGAIFTDWIEKFDLEMKKNKTKSAATGSAADFGQSPMPPQDVVKYC